MLVQLLICWGSCEGKCWATRGHTGVGGAHLGAHRAMWASKESEPTVATQRNSEQSQALAGAQETPGGIFHPWAPWMSRGTHVYMRVINMREIPRHMPVINFFSRWHVFSGCTVAFFFFNQLWPESRKLIFLKERFLNIIQLKAETRQWGPQQNTEQEKLKLRREILGLS